MEVIKHIKTAVEEKTGTIVSEDIVLNSFLFVLASVCGIKRLRYKKEDKIGYVNFFGTTFADQGAGKDTSLDICEKIFEEPLKIMPDVVKRSFAKLNDKLPTGDEVENKNYIVPTFWTVSLRGSIEGMMRTANYYDNADRGSLNVISTEFGSDFNKENLSLLMKLWQSGKAEGSTNVNEMYPQINDVPTNILLFGSPKPFRRNQKKHDDLVEMIESGLARRTVFVWREKQKIKIAEEKADWKLLKEYAREIEFYVKQKEYIEFSQEAINKISKYREQAIEKQNETLREIDEIRVRGIEKVERLSALIAIANMNEQVEESDVEKAVEINEKSLKAIKEIIAPEGKFKRMYELLLMEKKWLGMIDFHNEGITFQNKKEEDYELERLEYFAKYNSVMLKKRGSQFRIEEYEKTTLNKIIVSVNNSGNGAKSNICTPFEVPFFGDGNTIERLVKSDVDWFTFVHFKDNKRSSKNAISKQNCIAIDIDEGTTLQEAIDLLQQYTYILYTTKSHQIEKNGKMCDRFRIVMPTITYFHVNNEQHSEMIKNIAEIIGLKTFDVSTRNIDRLWFPNPNAEIYKNEGELIDVNCCIPDTNQLEVVQKRFASIDDTKLSANARIQGMQRWVLANAKSGNRNNTLMRLHKFVLDIEGDKNKADEIVYKTNAMLESPLSEIELQQTVCR